MEIKILIVEDDLNFAKVAEIRLRAGFPRAQITHVKTLAAARATLQLTPPKQENKEVEVITIPPTNENKFDLIILDQHLPDGLGVDLLSEPALEESAILAVSADDAPEIPGRAVGAGAHHFLGKRQVSEQLFIPLITALLDRNRFAQELLQAKLKQSKLDTIKTLLGTLRHEINNPLGAVLGATYLLRSGTPLTTEQSDALRLLEASGNRIKHVLSQLCDTAQLEEVTKGKEPMFHVPGDPVWKEGE